MEPVSPPNDEIPPSFGDLFRQLSDDVSGYFDAERRVYSVQARISAAAFGRAALYAVAAIVVAQGAVIALVVGLLLVLGPMIGPGWAIVVIVLCCIVIIVTCALLIKAKIQQVKLSWRRRHEG